MSKSSKRARQTPIEEFESNSEGDSFTENENVEEEDDEMDSGLGQDDDDSIDESEDEEKGDEDDDDSIDESEDEKEGDEDDGEDEDNEEEMNARKDEEIEELEKEYMELRNKEQDLLKNMKSHKDADLLKAQAVKNQRALWDKALELRFLLQKSFSSSNRLPQEPIKSSFCADNEVSVAYSDLVSTSEKTLDSLLELQEVLVQKNPSITEATDGNRVKSSKNSDVEGDEKWLQISQMQARIANFRNKSIDKWQRKTEVTTGAAVSKSKLRAFNQNISEQVADYMRDPSRMVKPMQMRRSTISVFGADHDTSEHSDKEDSNKEDDGNPELLDDSEFYQQLLKEFFETIDPASSETALYSLKRLQTKKRKIVDRRASKSRKIRYNIHEKIVNFMAPQRMDIPDMAPRLFENLFGLKT